MAIVCMVIGFLIGEPIGAIIGAVLFLAWVHEG